MKIPGWLKDAVGWAALAYAAWDSFIRPVGWTKFLLSTGVIIGVVFVFVRAKQHGGRWTAVAWIIGIVLLIWAMATADRTPLCAQDDWQCWSALEDRRYR